MKFSVRVVHSGSDPLGGEITEDHSFFTMTAHVAGKQYKELAVGETCRRQATTADGRQRIGKKTEWIQYTVGRTE